MDFSAKSKALRNTLLWCALCTEEYSIHFSRRELLIHPRGIQGRCPSKILKEGRIVQLVYSNLQTLRVEVVGRSSKQLRVTITKPSADTALGQVLREHFTLPKNFWCAALNKAML